MGQLYEDVENFFGDIFAFYGKLVARWPLAFILVPLIICTLLGLGLCNITYEYHRQALFASDESLAQDDFDRLSSLYDDPSDVSFYSYQQLTQPIRASIIISNEDKDGNIMDRDTKNKIRIIYNIVRNLTVSHEGEQYGFQDICATRDGHCVIDGEDIIDDAVPVTTSYTERPLDANTTYFDKDKKLIIEGPFDYPSAVSGIGADAGKPTAKAVRLRFNIRHNTSWDGLASLLWQRKFQDTMERLSQKWPNLKLSYSVSDAIDIELYTHAGRDLKLFPITVFLMFAYATMIGSGGNWVSTHVLLAQMGIVCTTLAILAAFGVLALMGVPFVDVCGVTPFIVVGVGMDHTYILLEAWRHTNIGLSTEERTAETFRAAALPVTIMSLTDLLVFCIGSTSPFMSIRIFCACSGVALLFCYVNQLTFFGGCLVLNARRVQNSRHCVTCLTTKSREEMKDENRHSLHILLCAGHKPRRHGDDDNMCKKIPKSAFPKFLLHEATKSVVILFYIVYVAVSVWGASVMNIGFSLEGVVKHNPVEAEYYTKETKFFDDSGPVIMFVADKTIRYEDKNIQRKIAKILTKAKGSPYIGSDRQVSWLDKYQDFLRNSSNVNLKDQSFYKVLKSDFLPKYPQYQHDIVFGPDGKSIESSRFYVFYRNIQNSRDESVLLINMRELLHNTSMPFSVYSPDFLFYEHHVSILKTTILTVTVTIISMLLVALVFIPHPIAVMCVTISMTSVVLGFLGFLKFWKLSLSAIKTIQLLIAVGLCLNFTVHMSHSFMIATGKSRNERVSMALEKVGGIIMNEAISLFLGILMLAFGSSFLFTSFFKCMVDVIALGLLHSMILLPVLLTFIGPRRTNKPKVFIPVSPSCRSIDFSPMQYAAEPRCSQSSRSGCREATPAPSNEAQSNRDVQDELLTSEPTPSSYGATAKDETNVMTGTSQSFLEGGAVGGLPLEKDKLSSTLDHHLATELSSTNTSASVSPVISGGIDVNDVNISEDTKV